MIEDLLSILVDIGLLRSDFKHYKKIEKQEKSDGIKRPFRKYLMQPSMKIFFLVLLICIPVGLFLGWNRQNNVNPKETRKEIIEISSCIDEWITKYNSYPDKLEDLISGRPLRKEWLTDQWNRAYHFEIDTINKTYSIISSGADGQFGNEDDIINNKNN